jgi:hypothetical protein
MLFIPQGLNKHNNNSLVYKQYIDFLINYMEFATQFAIIGLKPKHLTLKLKWTMKRTHQNKYCIASCISKQITPRQTPRQTNKSSLNTVTKFFDNEIGNIYE